MTAGELIAGRYRLTAPVPDSDPTGSTLWHAEDDILGRQVAVRLVCGPAARLAGLHDAATRAGRLVHDGVAAIYDTGRAGNCVYIVREWVPGESLQSLLATGPLDSHMVSELGVQLADVLSAVAAAGLRHRRLHLRNVIVTPNGGVKITDLETADALDARHAPEARWFGAILYGALTARWPYPLLPAPAGLQEAPTGDDGRVCSPTQLRAGVPGVLDGVAMRALASPRDVSTPPDPDKLCRLADPLKKLPRAALSSTFADEPAPAPYPQPIPAGPRRALLAVVATVATTVVVLLWVAARLTGPTGLIPFFQAHNTPAKPVATSAKGSSPSAAPPTTAAAAAKVPAIAALHDYDPFGDDHSEDPLHVSLADNGNVNDGWSTSGYKAPLSLIGKKGVGLVVDLGQAAAPHQVTVTFDEPGTTWQLRTADASAPDFASTKEIGPGTAGGAVSTAAIPDGVASRYWIIWLTALPPSGDGTYRTQIREISVR